MIEALLLAGGVYLVRSEHGAVGQAIGGALIAIAVESLARRYLGVNA